MVTPLPRGRVPNDEGAWSSTAGSSSIKYKLYRSRYLALRGVRDRHPHRRGRGRAQAPLGRGRMAGSQGRSETLPIPSHRVGLDRIVDGLTPERGVLADVVGAGGHRPSGGPRRRALPHRHPGGRCGGGGDPRPGAARPAAQPRGPGRHRGRPRALPGPAAGGGLRHRLPPDHAAGGLSLRHPGVPLSRASGAPLRLPRHLSLLCRQARGGHAWEAAGGSATSSPCTSAMGPAPPPCAPARAWIPPWA